MDSKKQYRRSWLTVMAIFAMGQCAGSIDAALASIARAFSLNSANGLYVTTVAALACVATGLAVGVVAGKMSDCRKLIIFFALLETASGVLAFFAKDFALLLFLRVLFGIGFGGMMALENTVAALVIPDERRAAVLGIAVFVGFGTDCLLQYVGGLLTDISWNMVFLTHLILIIPLAIILCCCPKIKPGGSGPREGRLSFPPATVSMWVMMALVGLMISPLLIGCSFLSAPLDPAASTAGIVAVCFSLGCMAGGLIFNRVYRLVKGRCLTVFLLLGAVGLAGSASAGSIAALCVFIFLGGVGFSASQAAAMMAVSLSAPGPSIAMASALMMALFNLGMFASSQFETLVGNICGDSLYTPLYIGAVVFICMALIFLIKSPFPKASCQTDGPAL